MKLQEQHHFELSDEQVEEIRRYRPEAVIESAKALVVLQSKDAGPAILHWMAASPDALATAVTALQRQIPPGESESVWKITLMNQADFVPKLLRLGFRLHGHYLDHWLLNLPDFRGQGNSADLIREARLAEADALAEISASCASDVGWLADSATWYGAWLADPDSAVFVSDREGAPVAFCCVRRYGDEKEKVWIRGLAVRPEHRRAGLGRKLLVAGLRWGAAQGAEKAFLAVDARAADARHLYGSIGFKPNGEEEHNLILPY